MNPTTRRLSCLLVLWALRTPTPASADSPRHFSADRPLDITHIKLDLRVNLEDKTVTSRATVDGVALRRIKAIRLDAVDFDIQGVRASVGDASPAQCRYDYDGENLSIELPQPLPIGGRIRVLVDYSLSDPRAGLHFFAPSEEEPDAPYLLWSQGESITNRYWVPCFDHPNERQATEVICTVDQPNIAISNGRLVKVTDNDDGTRTYHWDQRQPHVAYLMTLVVGQFVSKTDTWRGKPVTYYVREKYKDWIDNSFAHTPDMLEFFSNKIGVAYPWDQYAQVCCYGFGGGMENTSATTLGERTLHDDRAHVDTSSDSLVAHELAHQWWGDLLTCREWAHLWLNEGFASYFQALWTEHSLGRDEFAYDMRGKARGAISGGKTKPIVYRGYRNPGEQFDSRAYPKGAWVLHMMRRRLGDDMFWKVIGTYCKDNKFKTVETVDLRKAAEKVSGYSFERFFYDWTERPGSPKVTVDYEWRVDEKLARIGLKQTQKADAFHFPLKIEFRFRDGADPFVFTTDITEKRQVFFIPLREAPTMVRVDPDNAVLMKLKEKKPRKLWEAQLADDPNVVARLAAVDHFADAGGSSGLQRLADRLTEEPFWGVQSAIARALGKAADDSDSDIARDGLLAGLKIEHPKARAAVVRALGEFDDEPLVEKALLDLIKRGDPSYRVQTGAIEAYADVCADPPFDLLDSLLKQDSYREMIRSAALRALGAHCDDDHFPTLVEWSKPGKPAECRSAAIDAIGTALADADSPDSLVSEETVQLGLKTLGDCLDARARRIQGAALAALGRMGDLARPLLPKIDRLAKNDDGRTQRSAKRAAGRIRKDGTPAEALEELRDQLAELREENERLTERLNKLEAVPPQTDRPTARAGDGSDAPS